MKSSVLLLSVCLCAVLPARAQQVSESRSYLQFFDAITADRAANQQDVKVEHIETAAKGNDARKPIMSMPVTVDPNAGTSERQHAYLKTAGLSENEAVMAQVVLSKFRIQYDALVAEYNNLPETSAGTNDATPAFLSRLENLTQSTKYSLGKLLSAEGMVNLDRSIPRVSIKTASVYVPEKAQVISAAFHPGAAGQIVDGGCTLTPHYTATTTLSAAFNNSISLTTQILASSTTTMSGYASVSGSCSGLTVKGHESNFLGVGTIGESDPNCTIRVSTPWMSL